MGRMGFLLAAICFFGSAWAEDWYSSCQRNPCNLAVQAMQQISLQEGNPINLFVLNQTCIVRVSCGRRIELDQHEWLENLLYGFIFEYLDQTRDWPKIIQECHQMPWLAEAFCPDLLARYHIEVDLQKVLRRYGCGSEHDWAAIGSIILECLRQIGGWVNAVAQWIIPFYRAESRTKCLEARGQAGLPLFSNAP